MPAWARGMVTYVLSGGAMATAQVVLDPQHFNWRTTGGIFAAGAAIGFVNWIRQSPWYNRQ